MPAGIHCSPFERQRPFVTILPGGNIADLAGIVKQLRTERDRVQGELFRLNAALQAFVGVYSGSMKPRPKRHKVRAAAREKIAAAQRARWARRASSNDKVVAPKPKRTMSTAARRKIAAFQRARWAKLKHSRRRRLRRSGHLKTASLTLLSPLR
jgi:hypothetical protein